MSDNVEKVLKFIYIYIYLFIYLIEKLGHAVAQLVEVLRYKPEGSGFDSR